MAGDLITRRLKFLSDNYAKSRITEVPRVSCTAFGYIANSRTRIARKLHFDSRSGTHPQPKILQTAGVRCPVTVTGVVVCPAIVKPTGATLESIRRNQRVIHPLLPRDVQKQTSAPRILAFHNNP